MSVFLLDANVLIALAWPKHEANELVSRWFAAKAVGAWATCPITESAFVRTLTNPVFAPNSLTVPDALRVLKANVELPGHRFWTDDLQLAGALHNSMSRLTGHRQVTDAYLVALAQHNRGRLATLDAGIAAWAPTNSVELLK